MPNEGVDAFTLDLEIAVWSRKHAAGPDTQVLTYLEALTFDFERDGQDVSCVLTYAEPDPARDNVYRVVVAADTGYEGIACVDDTARAALLALDIFEHSRSLKALGLGRRWLSFLKYMQYPDGSFA